MPIEKFLDIGKPAPFERQVLGAGGMLSDTWQFWMSRLPHTLDSIPNVLNVVELSDQNAAISATDFAGFVLPAGLYRASYYAQITTAAGISSSLTVTLGWTTNGVAQTQAGAAITGNTTATHQGGVVVLRSDAGEDVTYSTAYASNAAGVMKYSLDVCLEKLKG